MTGLVTWVRGHGVQVGLVAIAVLVFGSAAVAYVQVTGDSSTAKTAGEVEPDGVNGSGLALDGLPSASASASVSASASASASAKASGAAKPPSQGGYPGAGNTGVPAGTSLSAYSGPCTITANNTVIDSKTVNCGTLEVKARGVVIKKSKINGILVTTERSSFSYTMEDSEVDAGETQRSAVGSTNMTIIRSNIHGGQTSVTCSFNCTIRDSYLHGQRLKAGSDWHLGGFLANDAGSNGRTQVTLVHNTIVCDAPQNSAGGGCSGNVNLFADFGPVSYVTVDNNLLGSNTDISYCVYGGSTSGKAHTSGVSNIVFTNNVFRRGSNRKCGYYGPVTSFDPGRPGNRWDNNVWDDGSKVESAN